MCRFDALIVIYDSKLNNYMNIYPFCHPSCIITPNSIQNPKLNVMFQHTLGPYRFVRIWHQAWWRYQWMHSLLRWDTSPFICSSLSLVRSSEFRPFSRSCRASSACFSLFSSSIRDSISAWDTQERRRDVGVNSFKQLTEKRVKSGHCMCLFKGNIEL